MKNNLTWFEINVKDLERAKKFYEEIFGSEFTFYDIPDAPMYAFNINKSNGEIGGALVKWLTMNQVKKEQFYISIHLM